MDERPWRLSAIDDQLEVLSPVIDFEVFRPELDAAPALGDGTTGVARPSMPDDGQVPGDPGAERSPGRLRRGPDQRPAVGHAVPRARADGQGARRQDDPGGPGAADEGGAIDARARFDAAIPGAGHRPVACQIADASLVSAPKQPSAEADTGGDRGRRPPRGFLDPSKRTSTIRVDSACRATPNEVFM